MFDDNKDVVVVDDYENNNLSLKNFYTNSKY